MKLSSFSRWFAFGLVVMLGAVPVAQAATLSLSPAQGELGLVCEEEMQILLSTQGVETTAADVFLYYNTAEVEIIDQDPLHEGVQIRNGALYDAYAVSVVDEQAGTIRSSAFSPLGSYNSGDYAEVYGTVVFRAKPGVAETSFRYDYAFGSTIDSNVADQSTGDVLTGVENATFTFADKDCGDRNAPQVVSTKPVYGARGVALDSPLELVLRDDRSGVKPESIRVWVNGQRYQQGEDGFALVGDPLDTVVVLRPRQSFLADEAAIIVIEAADVAGNVMNPSLLVFNSPLPEQEAVCGNQIVEAGETCEPPGSAVCDDQCQVVIPLKGAAPVETTPWKDYLLMVLAGLVLLLFALWRYQLAQMEASSPQKVKKKRS